MASVGSLVVELSADVARLRRDLQQATGLAQNFASSVKRTIAGALAVGSAAGAWNLAKQAAEYEEQIDLVHKLAGAYDMTGKQMVQSMTEAAGGLLSNGVAAKEALSAMSKGLTPDQLINLAKASRTLADVMGTSVDEAFAKVTEGVAINREKTIKTAVGVIDLSAKYGKLVDRMTEADKVQAMYNLVIERTTELQKRFGSESESTADKMEKLEVLAKNLKKDFGEGLLRAFGVAAFGMHTVAAGALNLYKYLLYIPKALAFTMSKAGVTEKIRQEGKQWLDELNADQEAAHNASMALAGKAIEYWDLATSTSEQAVHKGEKLRTGAEGNKKWADSMADAALKWKHRIEELDPAYDKIAMEIEKLKNDAEELVQKWGKQQWISDGLTKGIEYIHQKAAQEMEKLYLDLNTIGKEGRERDIADLAVWFNNMVMQYQSQAEVIPKIVEAYNQQVADINKKYRWQDLENQQRIFEAEISLRKKLLDLSLDRGMIGELEAKRRSISLDEEAVNERKELLEVKLAETADEEIKKGILAEIIVLEKELLVLEQERLRIEERINGSFGKGAVEGIRSYLISLQKAFDTGRQFAIDTAQAMEESFGTFFFDAMTGQLKSLADYWKSFSQQIMKYISDIMAKWAMMKLFGSFSEDGGFSGGLFSSLLGGLFGMAQGGIVNSGGAVQLRRYAGGGIANQPQLAMFGEGTMPEAYVPLPDGRSIPVTMNGSQGTTIVNHWNISAMDAQSFSAFAMQNQNTFAEAIMSASARNHPVRRHR